MNITVIGTGYVGLVSGTCFAETGNNVMCIDIDKKKIKNLKKGIIPIYEPGLEELVKRNIKEKRLFFSTDIKEGILYGDVIFSAVGTPPDKDWKADLTAVEKVASSFGQYVDKFKIFVNKSTVPVGTGDLCKEIVLKELKKRDFFESEKIEKSEDIFEVVSNPEFLKEGAAIKDTLNPDRIVVGTSSDKVKNIMSKLYFPFARTHSPLIFMDIKSAEITKYASNSFLATKISFINEIANFCENAGGDVKSIAKGMGLDKRIGPKFLHAGIGYGGSCFPKDVQALIQTGKEHNYDFKILQATENVNKEQKKKLFKHLKFLIPKLEDKIIAIFGLSFKPRTDDMRDAPSINVIKKLQAEGAKIKAFDSVAMDNARGYFSKVNLYFAKNSLDAVKNADALIILTEWDEFRSLDMSVVKELMRGNIVLDGRNILDGEEMRKLGFDFFRIGKKND